MALLVMAGGAGAQGFSDPYAVAKPPVAGRWTLSMDTSKLDRRYMCAYIPVTVNASADFAHEAESLMRALFAEVTLVGPPAAGAPGAAGGAASVQIVVDQVSGDAAPDLNKFMAGSKPKVEIRGGVRVFKGGAQVLGFSVVGRGMQESGSRVSCFGASKAMAAAVKDAQHAFLTEVQQRLTTAEARATAERPGG